MRGRNLSPLIMCAAVIQGCVSTAEMEARQLAYSGAGPNPCLWGGVTERASQHCAEVSWGTEALLIAANREAMRDLPQSDDDKPCQIHVQRLEKALMSVDGLTARRLYSCPDNRNSGAVCHVSLMVTEKAGRKFILDNGAVLPRTIFPDGVSSMEQYVSHALVVDEINITGEDVAATVGQPEVIADETDF